MKTIKAMFSLVFLMLCVLAFSSISTQDVKCGADWPPGITVTIDNVVPVSITNEFFLVEPNRCIVPAASDFNMATCLFVTNDLIISDQESYKQTSMNLLARGYCPLRCPLTLASLNLYKPTKDASNLLTSHYSELGYGAWSYSTLA